MEYSIFFLYFRGKNSEHGRTANWHARRSNGRLNCTQDLHYKDAILKNCISLTQDLIWNCTIGTTSPTIEFAHY